MYAVIYTIDRIHACLCICVHAHNIDLVYRPWFLGGRISERCIGVLIVYVTRKVFLSLSMRLHFYISSWWKLKPSMSIIRTTREICIRPTACRQRERQLKWKYIFENPDELWASLFFIGEGRHYESVETMPASASGSSRKRALKTGTQPNNSSAQLMAVASEKGVGAPLRCFSFFCCCFFCFFLSPHFPDVSDGDGDTVMVCARSFYIHTLIHPPASTAYM